MKAKQIFCMVLCLIILGTVSACRKSTDPQVSYIDEWYDEDGNPQTKSENSSNNGENTNSNVAANGSTSKKGENSKDTSKGNNDVSGNGSASVGNTNLTGFPIVKNKENITIMTVTRASDIGNQNSSQFTKTYSKMTNMNIKFNVSTEDLIGQRKTLALQSGNLPDIFTKSCEITDNDVQQYSKEGTFVEIKKSMLEKWAPNICKFYNDYNLWNLVKSEDGKMYSIAAGTHDFMYDQHYLWVNTTWLSNLGLKKPTNMSEFYNMLKAFKNNDPNKNGQKDEVPYATWSSGGFFTYPWGVKTGVNVTSSGKVVYANATSNLKECATFWNKVYKENLVDKNVIDNWAGDNAAFKTLIGSGKVGCFFWGWPQGQLGDTLMKQYDIIPWPTSGSNNGEMYPVYTLQAESYYPDGFFITKSCKNISAALRFLDYLYTNDGYMLTSQGNPGYLYTKVNDTTYKLTGKTQKAGDLLGPKWTLCGRYFLDGAVLQGKTIAADDAKRSVADKEMANRVKKYSQKTMSNAYMTKDELKKIKQYSTYFDSQNSAYIDYIKGTKNLNSDWTAMVNECNKKGLSKFVDAWQNYYNRVSK